MNIVYGSVEKPHIFDNYQQVDLSKETMLEHKSKVVSLMADRRIEVLAIYADREHGANFAYLTGFEPRFEEAMLILFRDGSSCLMLGNENLKMGRYSYCGDNVVHIPYFSLPNQPMSPDRKVDDYFRDAGITSDMHVGLVGWKLFTGIHENPKKLFDIPEYIVSAIEKIVGRERMQNSADLFLSPEYGVRHFMNANEIAHFEYGAGLASRQILKTLDAVAVGKTETEIASLLNTKGQPTTVTTICASGERFTNAVVFPRDKEIRLGEPISMTIGYRGGLSSRAGYVCNSKEDLPPAVTDYLDVVAIPYYRALVTWMQRIKLDVCCGDIYSEIETVLPKDVYHWSLNPGHYTSQEEWSSSPFYAESKVKIKSGIMLQADIIPSIQGYGGISAEDGIAVADEELREELKNTYPMTWHRIVLRKQYMASVLGIKLPDEVLPMSDALGYLRPFILNDRCALKVE